MAMKILSLGKKGFKSLDEIIKGAGSKYAGKGKKVVDLASKAKKKQVSKRAENLAKKQARSTKKPISKKEYEKTLPDTLKKKTTGKDIVAVKKDKPKGTSIIKKPASNVTKKPGTNLVVSNKSRNLVNIPKKTMTDKGKSFLQKYKKQLIGGAGLVATVPFLIDTKDSETKAKEKILDKKLKSIKPKSTKVDTSKITKPTTAKIKKQTLSKTKANDYTGKYIDKDGNVAYESFSDFIAHMSGKPKKRAMPKKTKRMIGEGKKLKRITPETKGAAKGVKYKAFKAGTKDKTVGLKPLPPKSKNPGIHKLPAKTKINMGFKPMFSGGFISSLYDKPEKVEKYKGNTSAGRQVKGYGKARKRP